MTSAAKKSPLEDTTYSFPSYADFQVFSDTVSPGGTFLAGRAPAPYRKPTSGTTYATPAAPTPVPTPAPAPTPAPSPAPVVPGVPIPAPPDQPPVAGVPDVPDTQPLPEVVVTAPRESQASDADIAGVLSGATAVPVPRRRAPRPVRRRIRKPVRTPRRVAPPLRVPRIPIPVPEVLVTAARVVPFVALLTLVPDYLRLAMRADQYGTQHMLERMFPPLPRRKRDERTASNPERPRNPDQGPARGASPPAPDPGDPLDTLVVTGTRPRTVAAPSPVQLAPFADAGYVYPPELGRYFRPAPTRATRPTSRLTVNPEFVADPSLGVPPRVLLPSPVRRPRPVPKPVPGPAPIYPVEPEPQPLPRPRPLPAPVYPPPPPIRPLPPFPLPDRLPVPVPPPRPPPVALPAPNRRPPCPPCPPREPPKLPRIHCNAGYFKEHRFEELDKKVDWRQIDCDTGEVLARKPRKRR